MIRTSNHNVTTAFVRKYPEAVCGIAEFSDGVVAPILVHGHREDPGDEVVRSTHRLLDREGREVKFEYLPSAKNNGDAVYSDSKRLIIAGFKIKPLGQFDVIEWKLTHRNGRVTSIRIKRAGN